MITQSELYSLTRSKELFDEVLDSYLKSQLRRAKDIDSSYAQMLQVLHSHMMLGGKRMRPYLAMLAYQMYGGKNIDEIAPVGVAWELLHGAMLVHDDIIDRDEIRHGHPNIDRRYQDIYAEYGQKDTKHYASMSALMSGDLLISMSQHVVLESALTAEQKIAMLGHLNDAMFTVIGGELMDTETALLPAEVTDPRKIAAYKTAGYSVELPLASGAHLAGASRQEIDKLVALGTKLGIAYQLIDDLLGSFGNDAETGKPVDSDIREKKHTTLAQEAFERTKDAMHDRLVELFAEDHEITDAEVEEVRQIFIDSGAQEAVQQEARELSDAAYVAVDSLAIEETAKESFRAFIDRFAQRKS